MIGFLRRRSGPTLADELAAAAREREAGRSIPLDIPAIEAHVTAEPRLARLGDPVVPAVRLGNVFLVRLLLRHGAKARVKTPEGTLHLAAEGGHVEIGRLLLEHGIPVNARNQHQRTPLIVAAGWGQEAMALMLLEQGANLDARDQWVRESAVEVAVIERHFELARALLIATGRDGRPRLWTGDIELAVLAQEYDRARKLALARRAR